MANGASIGHLLDELASLRALLAEAVRREEVLKKWPYYASLRALLAEAGEALERIRLRASNADRTFDECIRDMMWIDDECRTLLAKIKEMVG
jgi:3-deoxy-D-arabino-heptulosonate 7-phosphate (DAHP) synthase class II